MEHINYSLDAYKESFRNLNIVFYKTFSINGLSVRILEVSHMNNYIDWYVPTHKHFFYEFHYVCEGDCYTELQGTEYRVMPGQFYIIPPGTIHSHRQSPGTGHNGFSLRWNFTDTDRNHIEANRIKEILRTASFIPLDDSYGIFDSFISMLKEASSLDVFSELSLQLSLFKILIKLADIFCIHTNQVSPEINYEFINCNIVLDTLNFLEENYSSRLCAEEIANAMHVSYSHLSRLFRQSLDMTIMEKLTQIRLEKARELLLFTDLRLSDIAAQTGFTNEYYLINRFKSLYNISPGKFREQNKCQIMT